MENSGFPPAHAILISDWAPYAFRTAHQEFVEVISRAREQYHRNLSYNDPRAVRRAIIRFVDRFCQMTGGSGELERRAALWSSQDPDSDRMEARGCYYLFHVFAARQESASEQSKLESALVCNQKLGGSILDDVLRAGQVLVAWLRERPPVLCARCCQPLTTYDVSQSQAECHDCRSPKGKVADLDIAIRANGDTPDRIREWPVIRHRLRARFDDRPADELWQRCTDWLASEGVPPGEYLHWPLERLAEHLQVARSEEIVSTSGPADQKSHENKANSKKRKRSTERGDAREKLIAALTEHHQYSDDSCLNCDPIGNNALAEKADVDKATASAFFKQNFHGHAKYKALCRDTRTLVSALKLLNQEYAPHFLYGDTPPGEKCRED